MSQTDIFQKISNRVQDIPKGRVSLVGRALDLRPKGPDSRLVADQRIFGITRMLTKAKIDSHNSNYTAKNMIKK